MMKPILAVDVDNTIADTNSIMLGFMPGLDLSKYPTPGITEKTFEENKCIFTNSNPIKGAVEGLNYLADYWEIVYLTARPKWAGEPTKHWLKKHWFPEGQVKCTNNKMDWVLKLGISLALDDSPKEIESLSKLIPVCVYDQPYNRDLSYAGYRFTWLDNWARNIMAYYKLFLNQHKISTC